MDARGGVAPRGDSPGPHGHSWSLAAENGEVVGTDAQGPRGRSGGQPWGVQVPPFSGGPAGGPCSWPFGSAHCRSCAVRGPWGGPFRTTRNVRRRRALALPGKCAAFLLPAAVLAHAAGMPGSPSSDHHECRFPALQVPGCDVDEAHGAAVADDRAVCPVEALVAASAEGPVVIGVGAVRLSGFAPFGLAQG